MKLLTKDFTHTASASDTATKLEFYVRTKEQRMHLKFWSGSRRHMALVDAHYYRMISFLTALNCKFLLGNDAKRGGVTGDYIEVKLSDAKKALIKFYELTMPYPRKKRELNRQLSYMD